MCRRGGDDGLWTADWNSYGASREAREPRRDLRDGGRASQTRVQRNIASALLAAQVATSLALVVSAGLLLRTFQALAGRDPGFEARNLTTFQLYTPPARYARGAPVAGYYARVYAAVRTLPGVVAVTVSDEILFGGNMVYDSFVMKERGDMGTNNPQVRIAAVDENYWRALSVPLLIGRPFDARDDAEAPHVAIVNSMLAMRYYGNANPVGRVVTLDSTDWRIVGVTSSVHMRTLSAPPEPELYLPLAQSPRRARFFVVRSSASPAILIPQLRRAIGTIDPTIPLMLVTTMDETVHAVVAPQRFRAALVGVLGLFALFLSALGIYGSVSSLVSRQTREIGIRMALGEDSARVRRRVVAGAWRITSLGTLTGVGIALFLDAGCRPFSTASQRVIQQFF